MVEDHVVRRILIHAVEKAQSFVSAAKPTKQDLHLGDDEIGCHELDSLLEPLPVRRMGRPMLRLLWADRGEPPRRIEEGCGHRRFLGEPRYDSARISSCFSATPSGHSPCALSAMYRSIGLAPPCSRAKLRIPFRRISAFVRPVSATRRFSRSRSSCSRYTWTGSLIDVGLRGEFFGIDVYHAFRTCSQLHVRASP